MTKILFIILAFQAVVLFAQIPKDSTQKSIRAVVNDSMLTIQPVISQDTTQKSPSDSTVKKKKPEPLNYVFAKPMNGNSLFLNDSTFLWNDYRYTGDFINSFPGYFVHSLGTLGQPEEVVLYGQGNGNVSYFQDGMPLNHYPQNYFDLNKLATEAIDSVELVPLSRSFLFGAENNSVSLNAQSSFRISRAPYTRVKFYQGPDGEGMIDAQLHQQAYHKLNVFFNLNNRKKDAGYINSGYSSWIVKLGLSYPVIDSLLTISTEYSYHRTITNLWGGVNYDSLVLRYGRVAQTAIYDPLYATPLFWFNTAKEQNNNYAVKINSLLLDGQPGSLRFYYNESFNEIRLNDQLAPPSSRQLLTNLTDHLMGISFTQQLKFKDFNLALAGGLEKWNSNNMFFLNYQNEKRAYASGVASFAMFDSSITPALFIKYLHKENAAFPGTGADVSIRLSANLKLYGGLSRYSQSYTDSKIAVNNVEARLEGTYSFGEFSFSAYRTKPESTRFQNLYVWLADSIAQIQAPVGVADISGLHLAVSTTYRFILADASVNYFKENGQTNNEQTLPQLSGTMGAYYRGIHFDSALHVKAGFNASFGTSFHPRAYDLFYTRTYSYSGTTKSSLYFILNFTAVGEIKKSALVYFTWENLFDYQYIVVPYYPMARRGIRFGLAWDLFN